MQNMEPNPCGVYSIYKDMSLLENARIRKMTEKIILYRDRPKTSPVYHSLCCIVGVVEDIIFKGISDYSEVFEIKIEEIPSHFCYYLL